MTGFFDALKGKTTGTSTSIFASQKFEEFLRTGDESSSGAKINFDTALRISAVHSAVRIIAESLASLPLIVYRRLGNGGKQRAEDHPLFRLIHDAPNELQTSFEWRETIATHLLLRGNAFNFKTFVGGRLNELIPINPDLVTIEVTPSQRLRFKVEPEQQPGAPREFGGERIFHLKGLSTNRFWGRSVLQDARDSFGYTIAAEQHGARTLRNGAQLKGVFETDHTLTKESRQNFTESFTDQHAGFWNAGKTPLLEFGIKFKPISMNLDDMQFVELRKFQISEIARIFRVPLHMLATFESQPRANMEQAALEFVQNTLRPWAVRVEQAINKHLFDNSREFFVEHLFDGLVRGDLKTRWEAYRVAVNEVGAMTVNEVRKAENKNPIGPEGDRFRQPLNIGESGRTNENRPQRTNGALGHSAEGSGDADPIIV